MEKDIIKQEFDNISDTLDEQDIEKIWNFAIENDLTIQEAIGEILVLGEEYYIQNTE